jgi:hypothetical protein
MGRFISGVNVAFECQYWFTLQPSELGEVLTSVLGKREVKIKAKTNGAGEYVSFKNAVENRELIRKAVLHAETHTQGNWEATRWMLLRILQCSEINCTVKTLRFYSEY